MVIPDNGSAGPPPGWLDNEKIVAAAREVVARPGYDLDRPANPPSGEWLLDLIRWLLTPIRWCFEAMDGLPDGLRWLIIILLALILVLLLAHIIWSLTSTFGPKRLRSLSLTSTKETQIDPAHLEAEAERLAASGDLIGACRLLLRASLGWLQVVRKHRFRPGVTNNELLREYSATPAAEPLRQLVHTVDAKWYGFEPCLATDYEECGTSCARIRQIVKERNHAVGA